MPVTSCCFQVEALKKVTHADLKDFFSQVIKKGGPKRRKISSQLYANAHSEGLRLAQKRSKVKEGLEGETCGVDGGGEVGSGAVGGGYAATNGTEKLDGEGMNDAGDLIEDVYDFKRSQSLYGSLKGRKQSAL